MQIHHNKGNWQSRGMLLMEQLPFCLLRYHCTWRLLKCYKIFSLLQVKNFRTVWLKQTLPGTSQWLFDFTNLVLNFETTTEGCICWNKTTLSMSELLRAAFLLHILQLLAHGFQRGLPVVHSHGFYAVSFSVAESVDASCRWEMSG